MADYRKLKVWEKSDRLAVDVYALAHAIRRSGHRDLADQIKRSVGSIANNIAEGSGHESRKDFARFLEYSLASCSELENQLGFARRINAVPYANGEQALSDIIVIRKMLTRLIKTVKP